MLSAYKKLINCLILLIIFIICTFFIKRYFKPFFIILLLIFLCTPIYMFLYKKVKFGRKVSATISIILINLIFFFIIFLISDYAYGKIALFLKNDYESFYRKLIAFLKYISIKFNIDLNSILNKLSTKYTSFSDESALRKGAIYTTDTIFAYFIGNIAAYFILSDKKSSFSILNELFPKEKLTLIRKKVTDIKNMVCVEIKLVLITTVETILGFMCLGVNNSLILGLICGILDILPYVGTILVFLPLMLYNVMEKKYIIAIGICLLYIFIQINRQILEARFMSKKLKVHPLWILVSMYIGIKLFGIIGLFMGPLYIIFVKEIVLTRDS